MNLICPNSPSVWDGNKFSKCFDDMVLGFGAIAATVLVISILGITQRNTRRSQSENFMEKDFMHFLPLIGACLSSVDVIFLLKYKLYGEFISYHEWLSICSQFAVWISITLFSRCACFHYIFCNWILCFWWIVKPVKGILHLQMTFSSLEVEQGNPQTHKCSIFSKFARASTM